MKVSRITVTVLALVLLAGPALAGLEYNWVMDPPNPAQKATVTDPKLGADGTVAWTSGAPASASYNGSLHDFTFTALGRPAGVTEVQSLSVPNSNGYYVVGKAIAAPDPACGAWAYTSVGWTQVDSGIGVKYTVTDSNEDYAVMNSESGYGGIGIVELNGAGAPGINNLPSPLGEAGLGRISDNGLYITYSGMGWQGSRIHYDAGWTSYTDLGVSYTDGLMTYAYDVNDSGNVVGYSQTAGSEGPLFYNFSTSTYSAIPEGPFTGKTLRPVAINNLNQVVGTVNGTEDLFYYDYASDTTINLWDKVDGEDGVNFSPINGTWIQWGQPLYVRGINDTGWIVGAATGELAWGGGGPKMNAFLLTPEPATLGLLVLGGLALLRRRK